MIVTAGATNKSLYFYIQQDAGATSPGEPKTALLFSDLTSASYARQGAARTAITPATLASASAAHSDGGFILVDDTNMPGTYRLDVPDAAFATGVDQVVVQIVPGNNAVCAPISVDILDVDLRDSVRGGMTALPNAAADAAGGLPISDAGGLDLDGLNTNVSSILTDTGTTLPGTLGTPAGADLATDIAAVKTDTAAILVDTADMQPKLGTPAGADMSADIAAIQADTDDIQTRIPAVAPIEGTADSGSTTSMVDAARTEADADYWKGSWILFTSGNIAGQCRLITGFTPATDTITFTPATTQAVTTQTYRIVPAGELEEVLALTGHTVQTGDSYARLGAPAGASVSADVAAVKVDTAATLVDTGTTLPATLGTPAGADLATDIAAVKTDTAAVLVDTGTTLPATLGTPAGADLATDIATIDTVADAIKVVTDALTSAGATKLAATLLGITTGTVDTASFTPTTTEFEADDITEATADHFVGRIVTFTSGALKDQSTDITDYALSGANGHFTVTAFTEAPGNNDTFVIT